MRARREQLGWALPDVATWLRIRLSYLEALEDGRLNDLPGNVYTVGFLRTYATALGLDGEGMVHRFKTEARGSIDYKPELSFPAPVPDRSVPAGVISLLGGLILVGAYIGWYRMTGFQTTPPQQVPSVSSAIPGMAHQAATSPQVASVLPPPGQTPVRLPQPLSSAEKSALTGDNTPSAPLSLTPTQPAAPTPVPAQAPVQVPEPTGAPLPSPGVTGAPLSTVPSPETADTVPAGPASVPGQMTLRASAQTWVQVRVAGGPVIYDHILQAGESWSPPPDKGDLLLTVGNAGGLTLSAGGVTTPPLGRNGSVRRNLPLTPDTIRSGTIVAVPSAPAAPHPVANPQLPIDGAGAARAIAPSTVSPVPLPAVPPGGGH
nr:helix-turn-helix domain-containing protein [Gluconacetobacter tumulisoli]